MTAASGPTCLFLVYRRPLTVPAAKLSPLKSALMEIKNMSKDDKILFGKNGPGDIETIIAEIELETEQARDRYSKLKAEEYDPFEGRVWRHRNTPALKEIKPRSQTPSPAPGAAIQPKGEDEPDQD